MSLASAGRPVTVMVARRVLPGREAEFEAWAADLTVAGSTFAGFLGAGLLRPGHDGAPWHVVYRFDTAEHLAEWERSAARARLLTAADQLMRTTDVHRVTGLETWFELPGRSTAPPRWKMFTVTVSAIYLLQLVVNPAVAPTLDVPVLDRGGGRRGHRPDDVAGDAVAGAVAAAVALP